MGCILLQFLDLLVEIIIEWTLDLAGMRFPKLITVKVDEERSDIVQEFVHPRKVYK